MSSQRGNVKKSGPPKYKNHTAFKNDLHDTSKQTQDLNSLQLVNCCARCTDILSWKIKYKKYKPLTVPKKCTKCMEKAIRRAYCIVCDNCSKKLQLCAKCGGQKDVVCSAGLSPAMEASQKSQFEQEIAELPERKRRTFMRLLENGKLTAEALQKGSSSSSAVDGSSEHRLGNSESRTSADGAEADFSDEDFDDSDLNDDDDE